MYFKYLVFICKIPDIIILANKVADVKCKIPTFTNLITRVALSTNATKIESQISYVSNLDTKAALNRKAAEIKNNFMQLLF